MENISNYFIFFGISSFYIGFICIFNYNFRNCITCLPQPLVCFENSSKMSQLAILLLVQI